MHGLVNRAVQCFLRDTYGPQAWAGIVRRADIGMESFEAMLVYEDQITRSVLAAASAELGKPEDVLLEDLGTYLVSHPSGQWLRRLLRFGGNNFVDFLHSLDDLPDGARLAVPDLDLPALRLTEPAPGQFVLTCAPGLDGFGHVMVGLLRGMADDYGALVILDHAGRDEDGDRITIDLHATRFAEGRRFDLAAGLS